MEVSSTAQSAHEWTKTNEQDVQAEDKKEKKARNKMNCVHVAAAAAASSGFSNEEEMGQ